MKQSYFIVFLVGGVLLYLLIPFKSFTVMIGDTYYVIGYRMIWLVVWMLSGILLLLKNKNRA